ELNRFGLGEVGNLDDPINHIGGSVGRRGVANVLFRHCHMNASWADSGWRRLATPPDTLSIVPDTPMVRLVLSPQTTDRACDQTHRGGGSGTLVATMPRRYLVRIQSIHRVENVGPSPSVRARAG